MKERENIIINYVNGYNEFNIQKMTSDLVENIIFINIQNGKETMRLIGLQEFVNQATISTEYFSVRSQTIKSFVHYDICTEINIDYKAILAIDLSPDLSKGQDMELTGKSIFYFNESNEIISITDLS